VCVVTVNCVVWWTGNSQVYAVWCGCWRGNCEARHCVLWSEFTRRISPSDAVRQRRVWSSHCYWVVTQGPTSRPHTKYVLLLITVLINGKIVQHVVCLTCCHEFIRFVTRRICTVALGIQLVWSTVAWRNMLKLQRNIWMGLLKYISLQLLSKCGKRICWCSEWVLEFYMRCHAHCNSNSSVS